MQRAKVHPDVISYALLIKAYGKARREEEALAVFEEMLDAGVRFVITFLQFVSKSKGFCASKWFLLSSMLIFCPLKLLCIMPQLVKGFYM